jgi:murein DD-endopeptidase MepM/ murein hydrolase activator NlpD
MQQTAALTPATPRTLLYNVLLKYVGNYASVVKFDKEKDKLLAMDFTAANGSLTDEVISNTALFSQFIQQQLKGYTYGVGGYNELRTVYSRSTVFNTADEPRRLHLGIDIWGPAGTVVYAPIGGIVHSFAFNDNYGDYGATIILQHQLDGFSFNTLYGHLSLDNITGIREGLYISRGQAFAHFGEPQENGHWPPHLHFQVIENMEKMKGDYPGVCKFSEQEYYLSNSPDADLILQMMQKAEAG